MSLNKKLFLGTSCFTAGQLCENYGDLILDPGPRQFLTTVSCTIACACFGAGAYSAGEKASKIIGPGLSSGLKSLGKKLKKIAK